MRSESYRADENPKDHILDSLQFRIETKTQQLVEAFENSAKELTTAIDDEFQKSPWVFTGTCIGVGMVLGYLIGAIQPNKHTEL